MKVGTAANIAHITAAGDLVLEKLFHYLRLARATRRGTENRSRHKRGSLGVMPQDNTTDR